MLHFSFRRRSGLAAEEPLRASRLCRMSQWVSGPGLHKASVRSCACVRAYVRRDACIRACVTFSSSFSSLQSRETDSPGRIYVRDDNGTWWISFVGAGEYRGGGGGGGDVQVEAWRVSSKIMLSTQFLTLPSSYTLVFISHENELNLELDKALLHTDKINILIEKKD